MGLACIWNQLGRIAAAKTRKNGKDKPGPEEIRQTLKQLNTKIKEEKKNR